MSRRSWLDAESSRWVDEGLISADARRAILARRLGPGPDPTSTLRTLAVALAGVGVVLLVAWHWQDLPWYAKGGLTTLLTVALFLGAVWSATHRSERVTERWLVGAVLASYASFGAIAEISLWDSPHTLVLLCAVSSAATAALSGSLAVTALAAATLAWWLMVAGGGSAPWWFLLVFPLVALGAQQSDRRALGAVTAVVFAMWTTFVALNTWESGPMSVVMLLMAGAALEQWGRRSLEHRPVFAHQVVGTAASVVGLTAALVMTIHMSAPRTPLSLFQTHAGQSPWPALVLAAALAVIAFGPISSGTWRPRVVAVAALVWLSAWLVGRTDLLGGWFWVATFSGLLLVIGATLVRDAARSGARSSLGLGVTAVIALVLVHFSSGKALQGALVLLVSGAVLYASAGLGSRRLTP